MWIKTQRAGEEKARGELMRIGADSIRIGGDRRGSVRMKRMLVNQIGAAVDLIGRLWPIVGPITQSWRFLLLLLLLLLLFLPPTHPPNHPGCLQPSTLNELAFICIRLRACQLAREILAPEMNWSFNHSVPMVWDSFWDSLRFLRAICDLLKISLRFLAFLWYFCHSLRFLRDSLGILLGFSWYF